MDVKLVLELHLLSVHYYEADHVLERHSIYNLHDRSAHQSHALHSFPLSVYLVLTAVVDPDVIMTLRSTTCVLFTGLINTV